MHVRRTRRSFSDRDLIREAVLVKSGTNKQSVILIEYSIV